MKTHFLLALVTATILMLASGCNKQEPTPPPVSEAKPAGEGVAAQVQQATDSAASEAKKASDAIQQQADAAKQAADKAAAEAQAQAAAAKASADKAAADVQAPAATMTSQAQGIIEKAQKLLAEKNWSEAMKSLGDLAGLKLTPQQQTLVDSLKQQAQKMGQEAAASKVTDQGTKALGNLLNKK